MEERDGQRMEGKKERGDRGGRREMDNEMDYDDDGKDDAPTRTQTACLLHTAELLSNILNTPITPSSL